MSQTGSRQAAECRLRARLEQGLPLTSRPWQALAEQCGLSESEVLACVERWRAEGLIKRLGLVVRHRALGIDANAMVVWDVPDDAVKELGRRLAAEPAVTLCYRRPRRPGWPYNLFCMIHGTRREQVEAQLAEIVARQGLEAIPHSVLFSHRAYKQCGGRFTQEESSHECRVHHPA
ncbi:Lrp/AsnC family transcriptional regulator [Billgrantia gudaonensis]|uniref:siroheme decarboxylase n=1 Tax=Billgrantia gudaonensis TaxID=376427 RepID=A0A1G8PWC4_9GAMM|nr:Lrp/AsnC family transcriptional regulator [Halomonas gudaonensis]SDI96772.1 transcriptional regulator, AsnC family [Halomonas gudaonensis]